MKVEEIKEKLRKDERNKSYSLRAIDPIFQVHKQSKLLIIGQAPGLKVEQTGILFNDKSGERLVDWLGIDMKRLHGPEISILPMDFYYPGKGKAGDKAPRRFIAREYHPYLLDELNNIKLTILIGAYSQRFYLKEKFKKNLTETVRAYKQYLPEYFPIVHPSSLNNRWMVKNPFFEEEVLPALKIIIKKIL